MKLKQILSERNYDNHFSHDLIYLWEDAFAKELQLKIGKRKKIYLHNSVRVLINLFQLPVAKEVSMVFQMSPQLQNNVYNRKNILPYIIDFFLTKEDIPTFVKAYNKCPLVLISSAEAVEFLKRNECSLNIAHLPLSIIEDKEYSYRKQEKNYDLISVGRPNSVLMDYTKRYGETHKDFVYVFRTCINGNFHYITSEGKDLGSLSDRKEYNQTLRSSRIALYSTPGIDGGETRTNGFNQITPRFLEYIDAGCHVIARWKDNPDTDFYEIRNFSKEINSYEDFEKAVDYACGNDVDHEKYSSYIKKHYTSQRVTLLKKYLNTI